MIRYGEKYQMVIGNNKNEINSNVFLTLCLIVYQPPLTYSPDLA